MTGIREWLVSLSLGDYADAFEAAAIDGDVLADLTEADLASLGVPLGHRKRMLRAIAARGAGSRGITSGQWPSSAGNAPAERRQLTVLFCDLVGSTALSVAMDAELLRQIMADYHAVCRTVIESYEGNVAQYLGDGVMAYFGWPMAHEDDAERSLRAALELVARVRDLQLPGSVPIHLRGMDVRIGVATGPVVVGSANGVEQGDRQLAVGETPNLAARLQAMGGPGRVVIAAATRQLAGPRFEYRDLGRHVLKGVVDPVQAWEVEGLADTETRFEATRGEVLTPLVGRDEELQAMVRRWSLALEGEAQVVLISGEPGIGKSRLTQVLREKLDAFPIPPRVLRYQCSPFHAHSALHPVAEQLGRAAGFSREDEASRKLDKLELLLAGTTPGLSMDTVLLAALLGLPLDRYPTLALAAGRQRERTLELLVEHVVQLSLRQPVLVLLEDAHWIDTTTQELLDLWIRAAERRSGLRLMLVVTHRPEYSAAGWIGRPHVMQVSLARLRGVEASRLITQAAGGRALPDAVRDRILARTDGVPLFVEELTRTVIESGLLRETDGGFVLEGALPDVAIPGTLRDSLIARLDRLSPVKETAQIGACIGREFGYRLLAAVTSLPEASLREALEHLLAAGLVHGRGSPPDAGYVFKHALVQEAAYESLLHSRRQQLHLRIARALPQVDPEVASAQPEVLARHCDLADLPAEAIGHWLAAGRQATARFALTDAFIHLEKGLSELGRVNDARERDSLALELHTALGIASLARQGWASEPVYEHFHSALQLSMATGSDRHLVAILAGLATHVMNRGRVGESLRWSDRAFEEVRRGGSRDLELLGNLLAAMSRFWLGHLQEAERHIERTLELADPENSAAMARLVNHDPRTRVLVARSHIEWVRGFPETASRTYASALENARRLRHPFDLGWTLGFGCFLASVHRESRLIEELGSALETHVNETGTSFFERFFMPFVTGCRAEERGDHAGVIEHYGATNAFRQSQDGRLCLPCTRLPVAVAMANLGREREAALEVDACIEQVMRPGWEERLFMPEILRVRGWLHAQCGEPQEAEARLNEAITEARQAGMRTYELRAVVTMGRLRLERGRLAEARALVEPVLRGFTEGHDTADQRDARALLAACG